MSLLSFKNGQGSVVLRVRIPDSNSVLGGGKTGLTFASAGLIISTIADNEASATTYTQAGSTIETITTLGTYAAPTATKCRFKEIDAVNLPGAYEIQIADARWAVSGAKYLTVSLPPVSGLNTGPFMAVVQLTAVDPQDSTAYGLSRIDTNIGSRSTYAGGAVASVTGDVGGKVVGSVGSVLGNVAGSVASVVGNVGGNVVGTVASVVGNVGGSVASVVATVNASLTQILGTALTETVAGYLAAGYKKWFNVPVPTSTMNEMTLVDTTTNLTNPATIGDVTLAASQPNYQVATIPNQTTINNNVLAVGTQVAGIQSDTDNIQTRLPAALVSGRINASVGAVDSGVVASDVLNAVAADYDVALSIGSAINNAGSGGSSPTVPQIVAGVWNALNVNYAITGSQSAILAEALAKLLLLGSEPWTVVSPTQVDGEDTILNLTVDDDYYAVDGFGIDFPVPSGAPDLTGATAVLMLPPNLIPIAATSVDNSFIKFNAPRAITQYLKVVPGSRYVVKVTLAGSSHVWRPLIGLVNVTRGEAV